MMVPFIATSTREGAAEYSPDGTKVAYWQGDPVKEIWVADEDGANAKKLTALGSRAIGPLSWSPDSKKVAFHGAPQGALDIFVVDADKGVVQQLTTHRADDVIPTFSRNGLWIYFVSFRAGKWQIWKVPADGGDPELLIEKYYRTRQESWDGTKLYMNDWVTGDLLEFPFNQEGAQPSVTLPGVSNGVSGFEVALSGIYFTKAGTLNRYSPETRQVEKLFPLEGNITSVHRNETFAFVDVGRTEADLMMLEEVR
jgi:hypothetical protein